MDSDTVGIAPRRLPFTLIENVVLEDAALGPVDVLVYLALAKHADSAGTCWPSLATIGKVARCGRTAALASIARLEARGYLKRSPRFRPDGGVTSNFYQLLTVKMEAPAPVRQAEAPRPRGERPPVHVVDTNYIHPEPNTEKGEELAPRPQRDPARETAPVAPLSATQQTDPEEDVLAQLRDVPGLRHDRRFREGARRLLAEGRTPGEIAQAVKAAAGDPRERGGLSFVADRFTRWQRKARELEQRRAEPTNEERREKERRDEEERSRIREMQDSEEGRAIVAACIAALPWKR
jgi:hypothetical protein